MALVLVPLSVVYSATILHLERAFPLKHRVQIDQLRVHDRLKHPRLLLGFAGGVVEFPVQGSSDPYLVGLYFTKVKLGSPPREFNVQIDMGSDVLWVTCNSSSNCPQTSGLGVRTIVKPGCSLDVLKAALSCMASVTDVLSTMAHLKANKISSSSHQCSSWRQFSYSKPIHSLIESLQQHA